MANAVTTVKQEKIFELLASGNLDQFSPGERVEYIKMVCEATGLNPLTRPFELLRLNGRTVLYASKTCGDQLRKIHGISIRVTEKKIEDGVLFVTVEAQERGGRVDTDIGALPVMNLKGDALANAVMKAITKAKRRVTLSICGLGMLDESEFDTIADSVEEGIKEQKRIDEAQERIEKKAVQVENMPEIESIIDLIKNRMGIMAELFGVTSIADKGMMMKEHLGVNKFEELKTKTLGELQEKNKAIAATIEEKRKREKPTFSLEG